MAAIDLRYARALESVVAEQRLDAASVLAQLHSFADALQSSPELHEVLQDPSIPEDQKLRLLDALSARLEINKVVRNFIALICKHQRLHEFAAMVAGYASLADTAGNIAEVEVTSASPLSDQSRATLEAKISSIAANQRVHATYSQDPALLGGVVVRIGSTVYDGSIRAQLQQLKQKLVASVV